MNITISTTQETMNQITQLLATGQTPEQWIAELIDSELRIYDPDTYSPASEQDYFQETYEQCATNNIPDQAGDDCLQTIPQHLCQAPARRRVDQLPGTQIPLGT